VDTEIVHGIPSKKVVLHEGSIVSVDVGVHLEGLHADAATTIAVGPIPDATQRLLDVTEASLAAGIAAARIGNTIGDIGHAVQTVAEAAGFGVVRELVGHGIGVKFHEEPQVPNFGKPGRGPALREGMTIAIEPMITMGDYATRTLKDKWTVVTKDGSLSAHFEHTVAVLAEGPRILTQRS
jgi:methionyl aminopeptidase